MGAHGTRDEGRNGGYMRGVRVRVRVRVRVKVRTHPRMGSCRLLTSVGHRQLPIPPLTQSGGGGNFNAYIVVEL